MFYLIWLSLHVASSYMEFPNFGVRFLKSRIANFTVFTFIPHAWYREVHFKFVNWKAKKQNVKKHGLQNRRHACMGCLAHPPFPRKAFTRRCDVFHASWSHPWHAWGQAHLLPSLSHYFWNILAWGLNDCPGVALCPEEVEVVSSQAFCCGFEGANIPVYNIEE